MTKKNQLYGLYSEWDYNHQGLVFKSVESARAWAKLAYEQDPGDDAPFDEIWGDLMNYVELELK